MTLHLTFVRRLILFIVASLLFSFSGISQTQEMRMKTEPEQDIHARYRLFKTTNIWTSILLDTWTGRMWQVQYSVDDLPAGRWIINSISLLPEGTPAIKGRFTLYPTHNMYNFLLLDQEDGRVWQVQWSTEAKSRGIISSMPLLE